MTRPTLKDVAERSGVSLRTVKKVMSGDETVRAKTQEAVLQAAKELRYTRNRAAAALAKNRILNIAVVYSRTTEAYFPEIEVGFDRALQEFSDFGLQLEWCITNERGPKAQRAILESLLTREDLDGVIIQPYSASRLDDLIDALAAAGKPVVTFGSDAPDSKRICHVGPDAYRSGRIGAQILANYIGKQGKVFVVNQGRDHMQTRERSCGFMDRVAEHYPDIQIFEMNLPENSDLYSDMVVSILENEAIAGIFCTDANTLLAGRVLKEHKKQNVVLVGFNLSQSGIALMKEGFIKVIIDTTPETQAYLAAKAMYEYLSEGILPERIIRTPISILTSECFED